ncbi:ribonuclease J [Acidisphaera rubrifaciens]|uniref:Metal dependent hydrolase n=1 Tax=Acidisphaera rubrifaciens HS-AP3 TaxID=1231350 RepID=A0A0D6P722_9PROT|nr:ribonuclease J [Acidisphaera rubrifaciens]GAN77477.1 metal dependent hydrolase [Acidisphaera rubrifaciens HS-AP3]
MDASTGDLAFLPLGGTGEIGMNLNLYRSGGRWLAVDCGIGFSGADQPEADVLLPDPGFIADRRDRLVGLVITHAHEDHIGAVAWLWPQLRCPVYATPFAAAVLRRKLQEAGLLGQVKVHVVQPGSAFDLPPFSLRFIRMAHSIPEAQALVITTPHGVILHTGDWKLDPEPQVGPPTDEASLAALGDAGVLAMVCDSTNATVEGHSGSEADVRRALPALLAGLRGRVAVTCFASNVARVQSIALAAREVGRSVALVGRSLRNLEAAAREAGYLADVPEFVPEDAAGTIPDDNLLILVTGSQGEPRSALARIALDTHPNIALGEGDTVIFSSKVIPGNERAIGTVQDNLIRRGVRLMTEADHLVHVSGHPARDELRRLYALIRPRYAVPVHGEWRHLAAHAELAQATGAQPILLEDGDILSLAPGRAEVVDSAPVGRLVLDSNRLVPAQGGVMAARRRMLFNGVAVASLAVDAEGRLRGTVRVSAPGLLEAEDPEAERIADELGEIIADLPAPLRRDDAALTEAARTGLRRALGRRLQKRPLVDVHLLRIR